MTKTALPKLPAMPEFDVEALATLQKANIATFVAAQKILFDLAQTLARKQVEYVKESFAKSEALFKGFDTKKQPAAYADELKSAVERAVTDAKETVDLGIKAHRDVVDLFV